MKIFLCILFTSGRSQKIEAQYRNESYSKNITEQDYDTYQFDYPDSPVSKYSWNWSF